MVGAVMLSVDEFSVYDTPDGKAELVRGELRLNPPPSFRHGRVIATIAQRLMSYVNSHGLGVVAVNAGFELVELPRTVRSPDLAFLRSDRVPDDDEGFARVAMRCLTQHSHRASLEDGGEAVPGFSCSVAELFP
jgi:Uma2 family endonuclease